MQFRDLKTQYQKLKTDIDKSIIEVTTACNFISGKQVQELEEELAAYVGVKHCISCANGTDALQLACMALGIGEGDAVFVPDFTFFSSGEIVPLVGGTPVFVDVKEDTFNIDPDALKVRIEEVIKDGNLKPKAIVAVDLFGLPADYEKIRVIADEYNLKLIEDAAQGFGGKIGDSAACSFGDISTTSFFPAKPLGCYGDGGAVFTDDDEYAKLLRSYRIHGKGDNKYDNVRIGLNSRLDTIQAAILKVKLEAFKEYEVDDVNKVAEKYTNLLKDIVNVPVVPEGYLSSWAQYTLRLGSENERNELQAFLKERDIPTMIYYPKQMSKQDAFANSEINLCEFKVAEKLCKTVLSLPMHPYMTDDDIEKVACGIKDFFEAKK